MSETIDNVSRIVCDTPADDPGFMRMDCSVMLSSHEWRDLGEFDSVRASDIDENDLNDIRYIDMETRGDTVRAEIDLQGNQTCTIDEEPMDDFTQGRELSCWDD